MSQLSSVHHHTSHVYMLSQNRDSQYRYFHITLSEVKNRLVDQYKSFTYHNIVSECFPSPNIDVGYLSSIYESTSNSINSSFSSSSSDSHSSPVLDEKSSGTSQEYIVGKNKSLIETNHGNRSKRYRKETANVREEGELTDDESETILSSEMIGDRSEKYRKYTLKFTEKEQLMDEEDKDIPNSSISFTTGKEYSSSIGCNVEMTVSTNESLRKDEISQSPSVPQLIHTIRSDTSIEFIPVSDTTKVSTTAITVDSTLNTTLPTKDLHAECQKNHINTDNVMIQGNIVPANQETVESQTFDVTNISQIVLYPGHYMKVIRTADERGLNIHCLSNKSFDYYPMVETDGDGHYVAVIQVHITLSAKLLQMSQSIIPEAKNFLKSTIKIFLPGPCSCKKFMHEDSAGNLVVNKIEFNPV